MENAAPLKYYSYASTSRLPVDINIRVYDEQTDSQSADELEKQCEAGPSGKVSLFTDLLGDPLCRVRHYPAFAMLVAETQPEKEIVGLVRAGVKEVVCTPGRSTAMSSDSSTSCACKSEEHIDVDDQPPCFVSIAYILGLRVAPRCRRLGIGAKLVQKMEEWCRERGAEYVYIATEKENEASVGLFTKKLGYVTFRNPAILVQPVYVRSKRLSRKVQIVELNRDEACKLYNNSTSLFNKSEFFPKDIEAVVKSKLHRGTWIAYWKTNNGNDDYENTQSRVFDRSVFDSGRPRTAAATDHSACAHFPSSSSWAVLSLWKCNEIYQLEMKGAPFRLRGAAAASRVLGRLLSSLASIPTMPDVFKPFGLQLIYGLHAQGPCGLALARHLCWMAHNLAREDGCAVVAAEVAGCDPLRHCIPHWTCDEDMWCIKRIATSELSKDVDGYDWCKVPPPPSLFLDPRDF